MSCVQCLLPVLSSCALDGNGMFLKRQSCCSEQLAYGSIRWKDVSQCSPLDLIVNRIAHVSFGNLKLSRTYLILNGIRATSQQDNTRTTSKVHHDTRLCYDVQVQVS